MNVVFLFVGLTAGYFTEPIPVPLTLTKFVHGEDGQVTSEKIKTVFKLRREEDGENSDFVMSLILAPEQTSEANLTRFCSLLAEAPTGFDDFPNDDRLRSEEHTSELQSH